MRHAIFPDVGVVSLLGVTRDGAAAELALIGDEGFVGAPILLPPNTAPFQILVQLSVDGHRVRADVLRAEFRRDTSVQDAVLLHLHTLLVQVTQSNVCNRYHTVRQRLCRWLLMTHDRVRSNTLPLTQEFLGYILGATRKRVSHAATQLQDVGAIRQRHGQITIVDRRGLEQRACECYAVVRGDRDDLHPPHTRIASVAPARSAVR